MTVRRLDLEANADKTKYLVISRDQIAGISHSINTAGSSFERVEQFKYFGTTLNIKNRVSYIRIGRAYCYPPDVAFYIFFSTNIST